MSENTLLVCVSKNIFKLLFSVFPFYKHTRILQVQEKPIKKWSKSLAVYREFKSRVKSKKQFKSLKRFENWQKMMKKTQKIMNLPCFSKFPSDCWCLKTYFFVIKGLFSWNHHQPVHLKQTSLFILSVWKPLSPLKPTRLTHASLKTPLEITTNNTLNHFREIPE